MPGSYLDDGQLSPATLSTPRLEQSVNQRAQRLILHCGDIRHAQFELECFEAGPDRISTICIAAKCNDSLADNAREAMVGRKIAVNQADKFVLEQWQLGVVEQVTQD